MKTYIHHTDGGHGWVAVKRSELVALGILDKITHFSYQRGDTVYLEEDCDLSTFHNAKGFSSPGPYKTSYCDKRHPIRSYAAFNPNKAAPAIGLRIKYGNEVYTLIEKLTGGAWRVKSEYGDTYRMRASQLDHAEAYNEVQS